MKGYKPLEALRGDAGEILRVDCGTCPVTVACALEKGGNGFTYACCGSTAVEDHDDDGSPLMLMIDCDRHRFETNDIVRDMPACPLCSGFITDHVLLGLTMPSVWVPTIYARVPIETRLDVWRRSLPSAMERVRAIAERKKA
jgi:hypothetical protein